MPPVEFNKGYPQPGSLQNLSVELDAMRGLFGSDATGYNFGFEVILPADRRIAEPAEDCELTDMRQCVGYRSLEQFFRGILERLVRHQIQVELLKGFEEAADLPVPRKRR